MTELFNCLSMIFQAGFALIPDNLLFIGFPILSAAILVKVVRGL